MQTCFMCVFAPTRVLGATCESQELRPVHPGDGRLRGDLLAGAVTEHQEKKEKAKKCHRRLICNLSLCICFFSSSLLFPRLPFSLFATKGTHLCFSARRACRSVCLIASFLFSFFSFRPSIFLCRGSFFVSPPPTLGKPSTPHPYPYPSIRLVPAPTPNGEQHQHRPAERATAPAAAPRHGVPAVVVHAGRPRGADAGSAHLRRVLYGAAERAGAQGRGAACAHRACRAAAPPRRAPPCPRHGLCAVWCRADVPPAPCRACASPVVQGAAPCHCSCHSCCGCAVPATRPGDPAHARPAPPPVFDELDCDCGGGLLLEPLCL